MDFKKPANFGIPEEILNVSNTKVVFDSLAEFEEFIRDGGRCKNIDFSAEVFQSKTRLLTDNDIKPMRIFRLKNRKK